MSSGNAIVVKYWVSTDHLPFDDLKGVDEFRDELASAYVSVSERKSGRSRWNYAPYQLN